MAMIARLDGYDDGYDNGYDAGVKTEKIEIAKNFLKDGISKEVVSKNTGLSEEELNKLIEELNN